ncbi:MAG: CoA transferase [Pseudomonadales bacterium]|nr:CoA transferase [Pseudomonadales bacterium]
MADRVLEIGHFAAGFCGRLFARTGHEVVRLEYEDPAPGWASRTAGELFLHAGKRRIALRDRDLVGDLAARAQVVIVEASTADALAAWGFDDWPTPVKVALTPFGRTGPRRNWQATPHVILAMGGYTQLIGDPGRAPLSLPGHYLEFQAGHYAFIAASAARLAERPTAIDIGFYETLMSLSQFTTVQWHCMGEIRTRHGNEFWSVCPTNLYRLADGWVYVNVVPAFWDALTLFLDRPELTIDERFLTNDLRMQHRTALNEIVAGTLLPLTRSEVAARADAARVPAGVVQTFAEVLDDPHLADRDFWQHVCGPDGRVVRAPRLPWRIDHAPPEPVVLHPVEHTDD